MTLPSSGIISMADVNVEIGKSSTSNIDANRDLRTLCGIPSGPISLSNAYGKSTIIKTGLVFYVDAGFSHSYSGSGTTWFDISGTGAHLTLSGSPTFDSSGFFTFNGSSQYGRSTVLPTAAINNYALVAMVRPANLSQFGLFLSNGRDDSVTAPFNGYAVGIGSGVSSGTPVAGSKLQGLNSNVSWLNPNYTFPAANAWYFVVQTREAGTTKWYVNGVQTAATSASAPVAPTQGCVVGAGFGSAPLRYFNGAISFAAIYNTALTAAQVTTNFNIIRGRYGI